MPEDSPAGKLAATEGYGAEVIRFDRYGEDREQLLAELVAERGLVPIHPYDDERVMAGQGTVALELIEDAGPLDLLLVCVGGGGLISGCATVAKAHGDIRVVGVEPEAGDDVKRSLEAGERVRIQVPRTIADGQQLPDARRADVRGDPRAGGRRGAGERRRDRRRDALPVRALKTVAEPSGACALAALMAGRVPDARGLRIGVTISGGNVTAERFAELTAE